jgi:membrane-bound ClpP family serine protease
MEPLVWPIVLMLLGIGLVCLEIFVPSAGLLGVMATAAVVASIVMGFMHSVLLGTVMVLVATLVLPLIVSLGIKVWPHTPIGKLILAKRPQSDNEVLPDTAEYGLRDRLLGKKGVTKTELLPSGDVVIDGRVYDAMSNGVAISAGQPVRVVDVNTQRLVVRPMGEEEAKADAPSGDVLSTPLERLGIEPFDDPLA